MTMLYLYCCISVYGGYENDMFSWLHSFSYGSIDSLLEREVGTYHYG